jgi:heat shock protein HtpX
MATIYTHRSSNIFKTYLLMAVFLALVVALGYVFAQRAGNPAILWFAMGFSILMNVGSFWFSDKLVIATSGAHPADPIKHREYLNIVENLSIAAGLPAPKAYVINDPAPNAFATGRNQNHAAVAVTTGLLAILDKPELEGVIAHELSHIGNRDMQLMTVAVVLVGFVTLLGDMLGRMIVFGGSRDDDRGGAASFLIVFVISLVAQLGAMLLQFAVSRRREYLADASAALLTRYPEGLASALKKISGYDGEVAHANSATAHLYISNPFNASARSKVMHLFSTHPPVAERIKRLNQMAM